MTYPTSNANLNTSFSGSSQQAGVHAPHHDALATEVNAIEADLLPGGTLRTTIDGKAPAVHAHAAADVTSGTFANARLAEVLALADLSDVSGTAAAGAMLGHDNTAWNVARRVFSAATYGVVGDNLSSSGAANLTKMNQCISDALAAGNGALVALDWVGTAYFAGTAILNSRVAYKGTGFNRSKESDAQAAGTHVWATANYATLTQTLHDYTVGAFEFVFTDHWIDGNKANNATGGNGLSIAGYGYYLNNLVIENCHQAGWCTEWNQTGEPIGNGGSQHERAFRVGSIWLINNDCANIAAANTRATQARAALTGGQACIFGPGDSSIEYIEAYRNGSVAGIGINFGSMDFNTGTFTSFDPVIGTLVVWLNHSTGVLFGSDSPSVQFMHAEGATTCVQIACQGPRIVNGHVFFAQAGGTEVRISTGGNSATINLNLLTSNGAGVVKLDVTGASLTDAELDIYMDLGAAVTVTATAGSLPTLARRVFVTADNWGGATVTPGWLPLRTGSTTVYQINWTQGPTQFGVYTKAGAPTTADIVAGMAAVYKDSTGGTIKLYVNDGGTIKSSAAFA